MPGQPGRGPDESLLALLSLEEVLKELKLEQTSEVLQTSEVCQTEGPAIPSAGPFFSAGADDRPELARGH